MRKEIDLSVAELARRYGAGDSLRDVGEACGVSYGTVFRRLKAAGARLRSPHQRPKMDRLTGQAVRLYGDGMSIKAVGNACGINERTARRLLGDAGVKIRPRGGLPGSRSKGGPLCITARGYYLTYDRAGNQTLVHRGCWEAYHGPIPAGHLVHHKNNNRLDNGVENLACMSRGEHAALHNGKRWA